MLCARSVEQQDQIPNWDSQYPLMTIKKIGNINGPHLKANWKLKKDCWIRFSNVSGVSNLKIAF